MSHIIDPHFGKLAHAAESLIAFGSGFSVPQLAVAFAVAFSFLSLRQVRCRGSVRPAAVLRAISRTGPLLNNSTYADLFYFLVNNFAIGGLIGWALLSGSAVAHAVAGGLRATLGNVTPSGAQRGF